MVWWYIALALVATTGIVGVLFSHKDEVEENDSARIAEDIEIIE